MSHPAGIASFLLGFCSEEKGQQSLGSGEAQPGLVLLQGPGSLAEGAPFFPNRAHTFQIFARASEMRVCFASEDLENRI